MKSNDTVLTKRELLAAFAMQGMLAADGQTGSAGVAFNAVEYADALIAELTKDEKKITIEISRSENSGPNMYDVNVVNEGGRMWFADELPSGLVMALHKSELTNPEQKILAKEIADKIDGAL